MVHVEELRDALEGRLALGVRCVGPVAEVGSVGLFPGDDVPQGVFAEDGCLSVAVERGC